MIRDRFIRENIIDHDKNNDDRLAWFKLIRKEGSFIRNNATLIYSKCSLLPWIIIVITSEFLFTNLETIIIIPFLWSYSFFLHSTSEIDLYSWLEHETTVNIVSFNYLLNFFEKTNFNQKNIYSLLSTIYPYRELINLVCTWKISKLRIFLIFRIHFISIIISPVIVPFRISNHPIYYPLLPLSYFGWRLGGSSRGKGSIKIDFPRD